MVMHIFAAPVHSFSQDGQQSGAFKGFETNLRGQSMEAKKAGGADIPMHIFTAPMHSFLQDGQQLGALKGFES